MLCLSVTYKVAWQTDSLSQSETKESFVHVNLTHQKFWQDNNVITWFQSNKLGKGPSI